MSEQLTPLDATFLELEQAQQCAHMHIGGLLVFESRPDRSIPSYDEICDRIEPRMHELPHFGDRLSDRSVGGLRWPRWVADERFDVRRHIRRVKLPPPGGHEQLRDWAGEFYSERLDRARPLWEMAVVEGLEEGWAVATKTHHALVDGVGSVDSAYVLFDTEREPDDDPKATRGSTPERLPPTKPDEHPAKQALREGANLAATPLRFARRALDLATHPDKARELLRRGAAAVTLLVDDEIVPAPRTSINDPIGAKRALAFAEADLRDLKAIKNALDGTVNDVVLAAMAGGLRRLLIARGEEPPAAGLRAMVPVNVRETSEELELGNKITSLFVDLPVAIDDAEQRYMAQRHAAGRMKSSSQAAGAEAVVEVASHVPPALHGFFSRSLFATRLFNVTITNVPGPQRPLYALGTELREVWPLVPLAAEHALGLAVISYDGTLFFCVNADRDSVPDLDVLRAGIEQEIAELLRVARGHAEAEGGRRRHAELHGVGAG